ncbi:hypothetical protein, partial [Bacillus cereus group sp. Bce039]|uniref:hypothetical protein n=1 Tax=Bacillus cereus group sp. Bce039 TaxID=3445230 RepID=UPI003F69654F
PYIVTHYFADQQAELDALQTELDTLASQITELEEEHGGEEGVLKDVSTKSEAQEAFKQALTTVWQEEAPKDSAHYRALIEQATE